MFSYGICVIAQRSGLMCTERIWIRQPLNLNSTWLSVNFLTTVELKSRGLSDTGEWKDYGNIVVERPGSSCEDNVKMHCKINRVGGKGKGKFHPRPRGGVEV